MQLPSTTGRSEKSGPLENRTSKNDKNYLLQCLQLSKEGFEIIGTISLNNPIFFLYCLSRM